MRFAVFDQTESPGGVALHELYEHRLSLVERAEQAGFSCFHKSEHHMIPLDVAPSVNLFLAAAAQRTSTIRLASLCQLLPFHHPLQVAEEICMLDNLSKGRLEFGFGKGISDPEHVLWGLDPAEAISRTEEAFDLLIAIMQADDELSWEGRYWQFDRVPIHIHPYQKPYPPLWRPGKVENAAALGVSTVAGGPIANIAATVRRYHELRADGPGRHHTPTVGGIRKLYLAPTDADAMARARIAWAAYTEHLTRLFRRFGVPVPGDPTIGGDFDRAVEVQAVVVGSPERVRDHVEQFAAESGTDYFIGGFAWGDLNFDEVNRSFDLFAEHIAVPLGS